MLAVNETTSLSLSAVKIFILNQSNGFIFTQYQLRSFLLRSQQVNLINIYGLRPRWHCIQ